MFFGVLSPQVGCYKSFGARAEVRLRLIPQVLDLVIEVLTIEEMSEGNQSLG